MTDETKPTAGETDWLGVARDCFSASTDYLDANWRKNIERNVSLFQSKHPSGSKYNSSLYKHRSRLFRPKTRSVVRKNEAAAAAAFFANVDVITAEPENDADLAQVASAEVMNELLNYRLTKTIPWFMTVMGAIQEAQVVGAVVSKQYWEYEERPGEKQYREIADEFGQVVGYQEVDSYEVIKDKPCIDLVPFENIRFDPGAKWTDVVGTSPYLIHMVPMYVDDVLGMMDKPNPKTGQPAWKKYTESEIRVAMVEYDSIRQKREDQKQDPLADGGEPLKEFSIVWAHENFVRLNGEEVVYWTLGTHLLLTDPIPLKEAYFHGERPFAMGVSVIEAHKAMPESLVGLGAELQKEANETVNQRRDNVSLVLNKRYVVKRNQQVDIDSLLKNVPGSVTMANSPDDVQPMEWNDVTGSSYQEQDRLNVDFDDLTGNFSQGTVATNRNLNETVGGMKMLGGSASMMTEYLLRTFVETWAEKALNQLAKLEQYYETDETILALCGGKAELAQKYGIDQVTDELLNQSMTIRVNVGLGATDPQQKLGRFMFALKSYADAMQMMPDAEPEIIRKEVFGLLGYKDGNRFFKKGDQPPPQFMQQMQQMQKAMQKMQQQLQMQAMQLKDKQGELALQAQDLQIKGYDAQTKRIAATKQETPNNGPTAIDLADAETKRITALSDAGHKAAQTDLLQAQTAKTLVEAAIAPSVAMAQQAANTEPR